MKLNTRNPVLQFESGFEKLLDSLSAAVFVGDNLSSFRCHRLEVAP